MNATEKKQRIMIIHPEGNFTNNPNLSGILKYMLEADFEVEMWCNSEDFFDQASFHPSLVVHRCKQEHKFGNDSPVVLPSPASSNPTDAAMSFVARHTESGLPRPDLIIGVDRGIIEAGALARAWQIPFGLISYEIWYLSETYPAFKDLEIFFCDGVDFAICQDTQRAARLCAENKIPPERMVLVPVAGKGSYPATPGTRSSSASIRAALGLAPEKKIALYMGSITSAWGGIGEILASTETWPDDWVLVLHHRYGNAHAASLFPHIFGRKKPNVFFSPFPSLPLSELGSILHGVDLGIAFYTPDYTHPLSGENLACIGLASGKIATYLQYGVPLITNEIGEMATDIRSNGLGGVVQSGSEIPNLLETFSKNPAMLDQGRCIKYFERKLDLALYGPGLVELFRAAIRQ